MPPASSRRFFTARGTLGAGLGGRRACAGERGGVGGEKTVMGPLRVRTHHPPSEPMTGVALHSTPA